MPSKLRRELDILNYTNSNVIQNVGVIFLLLIFGITTFTLTYMTLIYVESQATIQVMYIQSDKPAVFETSPKFLSIGLDAKVIANGFHKFNMSDSKLIAMMKYLGPAYLRIGGNLADRVLFSLSNEIDEYSEDYYGYQYIENKNLDMLPNITLKASDWLKLNKLANNTNMEIFYGLNALLRSRNGTWDSRNAETMIKFSNDNRLKVNWELGNEPNSFRHKFNEAVNATQLAKDFATLRKILNKYSNYKYSLLVGPDVTRPQHNPESQIYLETFIKTGSASINKITWHQYYLNGHNTSTKDFLDPKVYDLLRYQINRVKEITNRTGKAIWLGETSSAYGGGAPLLSDRFISTFLWLDKLGLAAKLGVEVVMRQSIFYGNYSLLDDDYNPNPDWWISIIYKAFVGQKVIPFYNVTTAGVRLYAHCSTGSVSKGVTIFGFNVDRTYANVEIEGLFNTNGQVPQYAQEFLLHTGYLDSKDVFCNGKVLKMLPGNRLPNVFGVNKKISPYLSIPPFSLVFWIIPNVNVKACL